MNVLFANPPYIAGLDHECEKYYIRSGSRWPYSMVRRKGEERISRYHPFPFFLGYAAAVLKAQTSHAVYGIDGVTLNLSHEAFFERVVSKKPDVYVFEPISVAIQHDLATARRIREAFPSALIIAAGPLASSLLEHLLAPESPIHFVIQGEYEMALKALLESLDRGEAEPSLQGVAYRKDGQIVNNGFAELIEPLDALPFPAREIFPDDSEPSTELYMDQLSQYHPVVQLHASRGCPYHCYFCLWNQVFYNQGKYRMHSPARVVDEMEQVVRVWGAKEIYFDDDDFTISRKQVGDICDELIKRGVQVKWSCMGDAINLDEATVRKMAQAGCVGIKFGVESANDEVLRQIKKPVKLEKVRDLCRWCAQNGIRTHGTFSFGLINETQQSMRQTLEFACSLDMDSAQFSIATPYPGTEFFKRTSVGLDLQHPETWTQLDGGSMALVEYTGLSKEDIAAFYSKAMTTWLRRKSHSPRWLLRQFRFLGHKLQQEGLAPFWEVLGYAWKKLRG